MATKLKHLKVKKVDFVDEGANPDAHILLFKRKDGVPGEDPKPQGGKENAWKKFFKAFTKAAGEMDPDDLNQAVEEIEKGGAVSFDEQLNQRKSQKIADEIWDICYALQSSLCSIMWDEELDAAAASTAMQDSLDEFSATVKDSISQWSNGKVTGIAKSDEPVTDSELEVMKSARERIEDIIKKAGSAADQGDGSEGSGEDGGKDGDKDGSKGENDMIDKSKMTEAERVFYEDIVKRYGGEEGASAGEGTTPAGEAAPQSNTNTDPTPAPAVNDAVVKALQQLGIAPQQNPAGQDQGDDIYKGLHPAVKAQLEELKKYREDTENEKLHEVAKKYAIIGKKEEELFPVLKSLKEAGGTAYDDMIAVLDSAVTTVEKSGAFSEIGKTGRGETSGAGEAVGKIEGIAKKLMESDPKLDYTSALAKAWEDHPELMDEYDEEEGF